LVTLRVYCAWAKYVGLLTESPLEAINVLPISQPAPKSALSEAVGAILRAVRSEKDDRICLYAMMRF
jgi:hypothetical protein